MQRRSFHTWFVALALLGACERAGPASSEPPASPAQPSRELAGETQAPGAAARPLPAATAMSWPEDWSKHLGHTVTVEGLAANAKLGALLMGESKGAIWMDGMDSWPAGFYTRNHEGKDVYKRVRVTGVVIERGDLPVFIQRGDIQQQGMPVPPGTDLEAASKRYLLTDVRWTVIE